MALPNSSPCSDLPNVWISPCDNDYPHISDKKFVECTLFCADIDSPVTGIDTLSCHLCQDRSSDIAYVCRLLQCEAQMEKYLSDHFSDFILDSDKCCLVYSGPVVADHLRIDLENCQLFFSNIHLPACSDMSLC